MKTIRKKNREKKKRKRKREGRKKKKEKKITCKTIERERKKYFLQSILEKD